MYFSLLIYGYSSSFHRSLVFIAFSSFHGWHQSTGRSGVDGRGLRPNGKNDTPLVFNLNETTGDGSGMERGRSEPYNRPVFAAPRETSPILPDRQEEAWPRGEFRSPGRNPMKRLHRSAIGTLAALSLTRSEERRVGKECRSRWSPYH